MSAEITPVRTINPADDIKIAGIVPSTWYAVIIKRFGTGGKKEIKSVPAAR